MIIEVEVADVKILKESRLGVKFGGRLVGDALIASALACTQGT